MSKKLGIKAQAFQHLSQNMNELISKADGKKKRSNSGGKNQKTKKLKLKSDPTNLFAQFETCVSDERKTGCKESNATKEIAHSTTNSEPILHSVAYNKPSKSKLWVPPLKQKPFSQELKVDQITSSENSEDKIAENDDIFNFDHEKEPFTNKNKTENIFSTEQSHQSTVIDFLSDSDSPKNSGSNVSRSAEILPDKHNYIPNFENPLKSNEKNDEEFTEIEADDEICVLSISLHQSPAWKLKEEPVTPLNSPKSEIDTFEDENENDKNTSVGLTTNYEEIEFVENKILKEQSENFVSEGKTLDKPTEEPVHIINEDSKEKIISKDESQTFQEVICQQKDNNEVVIIELDEDIPTQKSIYLTCNEIERTDLKEIEQEENKVIIDDDEVSENIKVNEEINVEAETILTGTTLKLQSLPDSSYNKDCTLESDEGPKSPLVKTSAEFSGSDGSEETIFEYCQKILDSPSKNLPSLAEDNSQQNLKESYDDFYGDIAMSQVIEIEKEYASKSQVNTKESKDTNPEFVQPRPLPILPPRLNWAHKLNEEKQKLRTLVQEITKMNDIILHVRQELWPNLSNTVTPKNSMF